MPKTRKHKTIPEVRSEQAFIEMLEARNEEMLESKRRPLAGPTADEVNGAFYRGMLDTVFNHPEVRKPTNDDEIIKHQQHSSMRDTTMFAPTNLQDFHYV